MASNNNIFCATNPAKMDAALWRVMNSSGVDMADMLIFLPSRRAVRSVEKMLVNRVGHAVILPHLVALGEGAPDDLADTDNTDSLPDDVNGADTISNMTRVIMAARLYAATGGAGNMSSILAVAHDLVRMADYMENEGIDIAAIDWNAYIDEKYAAHFQRKAEILKIISDFLPDIIAGRQTVAAARNRGIRAWTEYLDKYKLVIVCSSTASVPATADLMAAVAACPHGRIILPGKISGRVADFELDTNPYNAEYKFLYKIGAVPDDVIPIDVGPSAIDFFNCAFGNDGANRQIGTDMVRHCHVVECAHEATEAAAIAEIAANAVKEKKSVLVITPDAAGNQRLGAAFELRGIVADFSSGISGAMTNVGRAILNQFDAWIAANDDTFEKIYAAADYDFMAAIVSVVDRDGVVWTPAFDVTDDVSRQIWPAIAELSSALGAAQMRVTTADARALLADALSGVVVRTPRKDDADVVVLGTIESRMQTADVVILSGLNEGMFPARGYDNNWIPRRVAREIGLPSPDRKVSLMALDFMNLSCGPTVYWTRSTVSGGAEKTESRFLSRVAVAGGVYDASCGDERVPYDLEMGREIVAAVRARDDVPMRPLDYSPPIAPADWSDVYVTKLELLIHNPYAFYAQHILKLTPRDDYWDVPLAPQFGTMVHDVIAKCAGNPNLTADILVRELDAAAIQILGKDNIVFDFWHRRFVGFAETVANEVIAHPDMQFERAGRVDIYLDDAKTVKRTVRARADGVWAGGVMDIKTGAVPSKEQMRAGTMPQLPLEALMHIHGGFGYDIARCDAPVMRFLQLQKKNVRVVDVPRVIKDIDIIAAATEKAAEVFRIYSAGNTPYEYRDARGMKYHAWDDLARVDD